MKRKGGFPYVERVFRWSYIFVEFKGALTEQYVLQELVPETDYTPYYYTSESGKYEMDFMVQKGRDAVPVEIKAENNLQAKSMKGCEFHPLSHTCPLI